MFIIEIRGESEASAEKYFNHSNILFKKSISVLICVKYFCILFTTKFTRFFTKFTFFLKLKNSITQKFNFALFEIGTEVPEK